MVKSSKGSRPEAVDQIQRKEWHREIMSMITMITGAWLALSEGQSPVTPGLPIRRINFLYEKRMFKESKADGIR